MARARVVACPIDQQTEEPVWGAPQPTAQRWGVRETVMAVGVAAVIAGLGGAAIFAATGSHTQQAFAHEIPGMPPGGGFSAAQMATASPALHGELVVADGKGGFSTLLTQIGRVTAISPTAITVRSEDAFTQTYELLPAAHADQSVVVSEEVAESRPPVAARWRLLPASMREAAPEALTDHPGPAPHNQVFTLSGPARPSPRASRRKSRIPQSAPSSTWRFRRV